MFLDSMHGATNEAVAKSLLDEAAAVRRWEDEARTFIEGCLQLIVNRC